MAFETSRYGISHFFSLKDCSQNVIVSDDSINQKVGKSFENG